jgi:Ca2+-binding EF-hand superfamily protein
MPPYEEDELAKVLKEMIQIDRDLESLREALALKTDFNLEDSYKIFDVDSKGHLSLRELEEGYSLHRLYPNREELQLLMQEYDRD